MVDERNRQFTSKEVPTPFDMPTLVAKLGINAPVAEWNAHTPYPKIIADLLAERLHAVSKLRLGDAIEHVHTKGLTLP